MVGRYEYVDTSILNVTLPVDLWVYNAYKEVHEFVMMPFFKSFPSTPLIGCSDHLPNWAGIYFVVSKNDEVIYIGQSRDSLRNRHKSHEKYLDFINHGGELVYYLDDGLHDIQWENLNNDYAKERLKSICGGLNGCILLLERFFISMYLPKLNRSCRGLMFFGDRELAARLHEINAEPLFKKNSRKYSRHF